eukprot:Colp12_sorted_trinity150504_noHs@15186
MPLDYSKWNNIEISDDEDDTHPNIDNASLFKWRHEARIQREQEEAAKKAKLRKEHLEAEQKLKELKTKLNEGEVAPEVERELTEAEKQAKHFAELEAELERKEKQFPKWNVDNLSKPGFDKTVVNKKTEEKKQLTEEEEQQNLQSYIKKHEADVKKFGMLQKLEDSAKFLADHPFLADDNAASYLVVWCVDLEVEGKTALMERVAHQSLLIQYILELAKTAKKDPKAVIAPFFLRLKQAEKEYMEAFEEERLAFIQRVKGRAQVRLEEARKKVEEEEAEERQKRLGPGGLDPYEVAEQLPQSMREAFEERDMAKLQEALLALPLEEAKRYMKMCADSGLWVPGGVKEPVEGEVDPEAEETTYEEVQ